MQQLQSVQLALASEPVKFTGNDSVAVSYSNSSNSQSFAEMVKAETEKYSGKKEDAAEAASLPKAEKSEKTENVYEEKVEVAEKSTSNIDDKKIDVAKNIPEENIEQSDEIAFAQTEISSIIALAEEGQKKLVQENVSKKSGQSGEEIDQAAMLASLLEQAAGKAQDVFGKNTVAEAKNDSDAETKIKAVQNGDILEVAQDVLEAGEKISLSTAEVSERLKKSDEAENDLVLSFASEGTEKNLELQSSGLEFASDFSGANSGKSGDEPRSFALDKNGKITVSDFRAKIEDTVESGASNQVALGMEQNSSIKISESSTKNIGEQNVSSVQMNMNLMQAAEQNILSTNNQTAASHGSNFQAMLSNQIQQNAPEFVKAGSIVLRDGNVGEINLTLNPEKLGNVKISLQLTDKLIAGQIVVNSREAYEAFKSSSDSLRDAFVQSGFEMEGFELSWSGQDAQQNFADKRNDEGRHFVASRVYGDYAAGEAEENASEYTSYSDYRINVTA